MRVYITRDRYYSTGIFGKLTCEDFTCYTLEHAYRFNDHSMTPKIYYEPLIPEGSYHCEFGMHRLSSGPIDTFEIMGVAGHRGLLIHPGNTNDDSKGCILLGKQADAGMIYHSRDAFNQFMQLLHFEIYFTLIINKGDLKNV